MVGEPTDEKMKGIIPRSFEHIVEIVKNTKDKKFLLRCSYLEIYNENVRDLLAKDNKTSLEMREHPDKGVYIKDLNLNIVKSIDELMMWMDKGNACRSTGATLMN